MFEKIVIGFDGTDGGRDAVAFGAELAGRFGSEVMVASIAPEPYARSVVPALPSDMVIRMAEEAREGAQEVAREIDAGIEVRASLSPARGLHRVVEDLEPDLLVVGSTGAEDGRVHGGPVARPLMTGGPCTVAVVPLGWRDGERRLDRVGVALDGSREAEEALRLGVGLAQGGSLRVIAVADPLEGMLARAAMLSSDQLVQIAEQVAHEHLEEALTQLPDESIVPERSLPVGDPVEELRKESDEGLDLLLLGSRSYGPVRRVLLGSVTSKLVADAGCPIIVSPRTGLDR
ncbi:MAG: universal stress protein [Solirubrobacterales bacterium]